MGYDVTFHPVSLDDIRRYVFDVVEQPGLSETRAAELVPDPAERAGLTAVYRQLAEWTDQLNRGQDLTSNETFAYAVAQIAGFLHPYWYARNAAISMLDDEPVQDLFVPLAELPGAPRCLHGTGGSPHIGLNYTASGVITDVDALERHLRRLGLDGDAPPLFNVFDSNRLASLREAIAFCRQKRLALIEATDVVVPITGDTGTDPDHFREAETFDAPSVGERQWFEPPRQSRPSVLEALQRYSEPLVNDTVLVKKLFGRNREATLVPLYMVPDLDRKKFPYTKYSAVLFTGGQIEPVLTRRLKVVRRPLSHRNCLRLLFDFERSFFEDECVADPTPHIESAQLGIGDIPERLFGSGLAAAAIAEWGLADAIFDNAWRAADIIIRGGHAERDGSSFPGNLANVLRTQWFAEALLGRSPDPERLVEACDTFTGFARSLKRSDWTEYRQRDYADFILTSLVAGRQDRALEMLDIGRPLDDQAELIALYRSLSTTQPDTPVASAVRESALELLSVMRHPNGGQFLRSGRLAALQLAYVTDQSLSATRRWSSMRDIAEWLGE